MPDNVQARSDDMHKTGQKKPNPFSGIIILVILAALIALLIYVAR